MITVLCTMAVVVVMAIAGCLPDQPENVHCTQGPGWRSECTERQSGAVVHPSGLDRRTDGVVRVQSVRHPGQPRPPGGDPGRAGVESADAPAAAPPSAPSKLRAAFTPIDSTAARVSGSGDAGFPTSHPSAPQSLVGALSPDGASTRLHRVRVHG